MTKLSYSAKSDRSYIAFYKPYGVLCQFSVPEDSNKETLARFNFPRNVYPVGRLDFDSEGLIILTDDTRLNELLLSPENAHGRTYLAQVENVPTDNALANLRQGVQIEGRMTRPAEAKLLGHEPAMPPRAVPIRERKNIPTAWLVLTLTEGKNRQVRKMTAAIGCPTLRLVRIAIGKLRLAETQLQPGEWKLLSPDEVRLLFS